MNRIRIKRDFDFNPFIGRHTYLDSMIIIYCYLMSRPNELRPNENLADAENHVHSVNQF